MTIITSKEVVSQEIFIFIEAISEFNIVLANDEVQKLLPVTAEDASITKIAKYSIAKIPSTILAKSDIGVFTKNIATKTIDITEILSRSSVFVIGQAHIAFVEDFPTPGIE